MLPAAIETDPLTRELVRRDEPLLRHTSMRVGGPADFFCEPESEAQLARLIHAARDAGLKVFVLGGGTNLIVADRGIRGLTVKLGRAFASTAWHEVGPVVRVRVGAAASFKKLVLQAIARGLTGLEFGEGIPGTAGGGVLMNAGAFGGEIKDVVEAVHGVSAAGEPTVLARSDLRFDYRRLDLPRGFIVTALEVVLRPGDPAAIAERVADAKRRRVRHQPLGLPNAGSIFKNPPGDFAGRLVELVGLKGATIGRAQISPRHANFIVNLGGAAAADVRRLIVEARDAVWARRGVWLTPEVKLVGDW
jgi:UDP-N-acetylmuramate dehydrogenase